MIIVAILAGVALFSTHPQERHDLGAGWVLSVGRHAFADTASCSLRNHAVSYRRGAVEFRFRSGTRTTRAVYRIDDGPPTRAVDDRATLAERGVTLTMDDLNNPSGGRVWIPLEHLRTAGKVRIDPDNTDRPVSFSVDGVQAAIDASRGWGCDDASFS